MELAMNVMNMKTAWTVYTIAMLLWLGLIVWG